jgi:hypothetical protein
MSDSRNEPDRVDLRALASTDVQADRVIGGVMSRLATRPQIVEPPPSDVLTIVGRHFPPAWIAAAAALAIAASAAVVASRRNEAAATSIDMTVATWAAQQHVPTNAELLAAFQGYQR